MVRYAQRRNGKMRKIIITILILIICGILWTLPLWIAVNLVCWVFGITFHLSLLQAFAIYLLASVIKTLLFGSKESK